MNIGGTEGGRRANKCKRVKGNTDAEKVLRNEGRWWKEGRRGVSEPSAS